MLPRSTAVVPCSGPLQCSFVVDWWWSPFGVPCVGPLWLSDAVVSRDGLSGTVGYFYCLHLVLITRLIRVLVFFTSGRSKFLFIE